MGKQGLTSQQQEARRLLADAVKQGEQNMINLVRSGKAKFSDDAYVALTGLAVHAGFVVEGNAIQVSTEELLRVQQFIATCDEYTPGPDFPFTKEQLRQAWNQC